MAGLVMVSITLLDSFDAMFGDDVGPAGTAPEFQAEAGLAPAESDALLAAGIAGDGTPLQRVEGGIVGNA